MTEPQADAPSADLVRMRQDFDLAVTAEAGITASDDLARVRRTQQDLTVALSGRPNRVRCPVVSVEAEFVFGSWKIGLSSYDQIAGRYLVTLGLPFMVQMIIWTINGKPRTCSTSSTGAMATWSTGAFARA